MPAESAFDLSESLWKAIPDRSFFTSRRNFYPITTARVQWKRAVLVDSTCEFFRQQNCISNREFEKGGEHVRKGVQEQYVYSKPTMCLHCHLIVEWFMNGTPTPKKGHGTVLNVVTFIHSSIGRFGNSPPRKAEAA
jgi:hypothetical protein